MTSSVQTFDPVQRYTGTETGGDNELSVYTSVKDINPNLMTFSYAEAYQNQLQTWVVRRGYESITGSDITDQVLSFQRRGDAMSDRTLTSRRGSEIQSALDLAVTAVSQRLSTDSMFVNQVLLWRNSNREMINEVLGKIARIFRENISGIVDGELPKNQDESKTLRDSLNIFIDNIENLSAELPKSHTYLGDLKLQTKRCQTNLLRAINQKRNDLEAVRLWGFHNWYSLLVMLLPVLSGQVVEIIDSELVETQHGPRCRYTVKLAGLPIDYAELVQPKVFRRADRLVFEFHRRNGTKPWPKDREFAT